MTNMYANCMNKDIIFYRLNKQGQHQIFIAKSMNKNKSPISKELYHNTGNKGYRHKQAVFPVT